MKDMKSVIFLFFDPLLRTLEISAPVLTSKSWWKERWTRARRLWKNKKNMGSQGEDTVLRWNKSRESRERIERNSHEKHKTWKRNSRKLSSTTDSINSTSLLILELFPWILLSLIIFKCCPPLLSFSLSLSTSTYGLLIALQIIMASPVFCFDANIF